MSTTAEAGERKYKTLAANTALISFGTVGSKLMVFFMVRFYTGYMSPADYGTADIITQTANLLIPLVSLGMAEGVFRFAALRPDNGREAFTSGLACSVLGTALLALLMPRTEFAGQYGTLLTVYIAASCMHSMSAQYVRALGDMTAYALQGLINTALVIGFNIALLAVFRLGITGYVLSVAAADAGCTLDELSKLFESLGCSVAYNLDGGQSSVMVWDGGSVTVNMPAGGGRAVGDIIYISKE